MNRVVICMSGGFDSSVLGGLSRGAVDLFPIFFEYAQPSLSEERASLLDFCSAMDLRDPMIVQLPPLQANDKSLSLPYYPFRNLLFATHAAVYAQHLGASEVWLGFIADANATAFPDSTDLLCTQVNILLESVYGSKATVTVRSPNSTMRKRDLVMRAYENNLPTDITYSCYRPNGRCRSCGACKAVISAFASAATGLSESKRHELDMLNPYAVANVGQ